MKKKLVSLMLVAAMAATMAAGCGTNNGGGNNAGTDDKQTEDTNSGDDKEEAGDDSQTAASGDGAVYYLNFKPEQADQWKALAETYTEQTGVPVTVETAASGTYESTLKSEMAKDEAPTLFQVNGPDGLASWKDYCYDLKDSAVYKNLKSDDFALISDSGEVQGVAYVIETYGLIYNKKLLSDYCALDGAKIKDASEINSFAKLKEVADDIQAKKDDLGIVGAFTSAGMDSSSDWRFKTHLANLPIYYEYQADGIESTDAIKGTYLDNYKNVWDLYITDSTVESTMLSSATGEDAAAEFAMGEAVFYQNGTWAYADIKDNEVADEDLGMMPIYIGAEGEENQGLCTGSENYWCVNKNASQEDIDATLAFLEWVITSDEGRTSFRDEMGFVTPFTTFTDEYQPANPLVAASQEDIDAGHQTVAWCFTTMPSEEWKNGVGSALLEYAQGTGQWDAVVSAFVDGWTAEVQAVSE
ncbi:ABC transporter substrate-binding protein [Petralouisia muris]|uniref:ABC transporter substrate-binding protein n=1 Tax=Petralouisia muris TaxID=3032872 RepID=A0AC61RZV6_9FIRM|nr:ABC transporter substrate-binding protein [Petralouisia muris]TGY97723.1 ABC transporter substrate-binding protein [Petralouisia muris]